MYKFDINDLDGVLVDVETGTILGTGGIYFVNANNAERWLDKYAYDIEGLGEDHPNVLETVFVTAE